MDVSRSDNKQLQTACFTELQADYNIDHTSDQDFPSLKDLTEHLNKGILISSEITSDEESHLDVSDEGAGLLLMWGCGEFGQHGHGHQNDVTISAGSMNHLILGQDSLIVLVACGSSHTIAVTDDNRIYSWGNCNSGQLGIGDTKTTLQPHLVQLGMTPGTRIRGVTCGTRHTFLWTEEGDCFSFGNNFSAQLGYDFRKPDFKENQIRPVYLETLFNQRVHQVACGSRHSVFLFTSGSVASVGSNDHGQLGYSDKTDSVWIQKVADVTNVSTIGCGNCHSLAADRDGNVYGWGYGKACGSKEDILSPALIYTAEGDSTTIAGLVGGDSHSLLLLNNGKLLSWGNNYEGQLGLGIGVKFSSKPTEIKDGLAEENIVSMSAGENTTAAVTESGGLFMWGKNVSQVIREDEGQRYCQFVPQPVPLGKWKATKVACGAWHVACIVSPDARINTWDWTPPHVDIPVTAEINLFEAQQDAEDVSFDENNSGILQEISKVEDMVDEYSRYTEKDITTKNSKTELMQCDKDHEKMDSINLVQSATSVIIEHTEKDCYVDERCTDDTIQNETPKISVENNIKVDNDDSKDHNSGVKGMEQRDSQKNRLAEGVVKKKRSQSAHSCTKYKTDKTQPKDRSSFRRTSSAGSVNPSGKPLHISKSLCNIVLVSEGEGVIPERRSSTGTIESTSRNHSTSAGIRNTENQIQSTESLSSGSISSHEDVENCIVSSLLTRKVTDDTCSSPLPSTHVDLCKGGRTAQLNREKKAPRHLRRIPSVPKMEYYLPNQPIHSEEFSKRINRTCSSPNITTNHQSDIHAITLSMPSGSSSGIHMPHPPATDGLPPRHPRFRKKPSAQKIVFSSGSSWRKRSSNVQ